MTLGQALMLVGQALMSRDGGTGVDVGGGEAGTGSSWGVLGIFSCKLEA